MKNHKTARFPLLAAMLLSTLALSACTTVGYRCPLATDKKSEYPTACASMQDAMTGARKGTGGKTSVLMDDKGRLVPRELLENKAATPLAGQLEPYRTKSGDPVFTQPKVFQAWTGAFVDAEGNLHDGHNSWFATPGRWAYGTVDRPGDVGANTMRPALPDARPAGRIVKVDRQTGRPIEQKPAAESVKERDKAALQSLSGAANSAAAAAAAKAQSQPAAAKPANASGVTAPAVGLGD